MFTILCWSNEGAVRLNTTDLCLSCICYDFLAFLWRDHLGRHQHDWIGGGGGAKYQNLLTIKPTTTATTILVGTYVEFMHDMSNLTP